jgi:hypothetical protein
MYVLFSLFVNGRVSAGRDLFEEGQEKPTLRGVDEALYLSVVSDLGGTSA